MSSPSAIAVDRLVKRYKAATAVAGIGAATLGECHRVLLLRTQADAAAPAAECSARRRRIAE